MLNHELNRTAQQEHVVLHNADVDDEVNYLRVDVRWVFSLEDVRNDPLVMLLLWRKDYSLQQRFINLVAEWNE